MINKNKFSIKDTKKVLHKVGKKWVVVSAVLLGLAAGGAAVTTANANADNTQAAQPQAEAQANHETAANNTVTQPSRMAGLGTEFGGSAPTTTDLNGIVNDAKGKISKKASSAKARIQKDSSDADVTNLTKLAKTVHSNTAASNAYQNLGSLASSASNYSNISLGSDVANPTASTAFGMFSQASNDFKAISNAQNTSNGQHYLSNITSLFNEASDYNSTISSHVDSSSPFPVELSGHSLNYTMNSQTYNISLTGSITPTLLFNSNVSINIPNTINSGLNITNFVDSVASILKAENSAPSSTVLTQVETSNDESIYNQAISSGASNYAKKYLMANGIDPSLINATVNDTVNDLNKYLPTDTLLSNPYLQKTVSKYIPLAKNLNSLLNNTASNAKESLSIATKNNDNNGVINAFELIAKDTHPYINEKTLINKEVSNSASAPYSSAVSSTLSSVANSVASFAGSLFATSSSTVGTSLNYSFGPFANYNLSSVTSYINRVNGNLSSANSQLTSASDANNMSNYISGLGFPVTLGSTISGLVSTASNYVNKASGYVNDVTSGLNGFFNGKVTAPDYENLINATKALPNDLRPTSNAASGSTEEAKLYNDYSSIASNTSDIDSAAMNHMGTYNNGRVKRYISDAARDATNSIVNEANSSAQSMSDETQSFNNAVTSVNTASESIANYKNKPNYTKAYNSALTQVNNDSSAISAESSAYANSLANMIVSGSTASQFANDAKNIGSLSANKQVIPHHNKNNGGGSTDTGNNGYTPSFVFPSTPTNNMNYNVVPTNNNTVVPEIIKKHAANYAKVIKDLQLHTNPNFTKKNAVAVVKPNTTFNIERAVKAHNGALRYEVKYNKKNYYITANKHWVYAYYKAAGHNYTNISNYVHYRYTKVIKALQLHAKPYFTKRNGVAVVKPGTEFHINRIVKSHGLVRYEVRYQGHNYFITANHDYTVNAYVQKYNFRKHGYKAVRVIKPLNEYRKLNFAKRSFIRHFYRGSVLPVKKVITIANGEMTRLQLTNGRYVTANKNFVEVIK